MCGYCRDDRVCARILFNALLGNISSEAERENDGVFSLEDAITVSFFRSNI